MQQTLQKNQAQRKALIKEMNKFRFKILCLIILVIIFPVKAVCDILHIQFVVYIVYSGKVAIIFVIGRYEYGYLRLLHEEFLLKWAPAFWHETSEAKKNGLTKAEMIEIAVAMDAKLPQPLLSSLNFGRRKQAPLANITALLKKAGVL